MKIKYLTIALISIPFLALSCNQSSPQTELASPTTLPVQTILVKGIEVKAEMASTPSSKELGLSGREFLGANQGMLFDFSGTAITRPAFWMKDMKFDIDILWIANNTIVAIDHNVPYPKDSNNLPTYSPPTEINYVLEMPAGWSRQNKIQVGDKVEL